MNAIPVLLLGLVVGLVVGVLIEYFHSKKYKVLADKLSHENTYLQMQIELLKEQKEREIQLIKEKSETEQNTLKEANESLQKALKRSEEEMREKSDIMKAEFRNLSNEILDIKSAALKEKNNEQLEAVLAPLKENVEKLGKSVIDNRVTSAQYKESFEHAIKGLLDKTEKIGEDAVNLTKALKANPKIQGDWGEMILERMLEESGLRKGEEYFVQENCITEDGRNVRPDIIIRFPEKRCVIVDSKVSLTAYVNYINSTSYNEQAQALSAHVASMREHINELAVKDYSKVVKDSIGYVLMFVPNEGSYIAALEKDRELLNYAYKKHIIIISPSNLMMALQLAYNLWQSEKQSRNVEEIIRRGNLLYEKFVTFITTFEKIGKQLDETKKQYESAFGTLARGNGNIISSFNKMKELGLTPKRNIPTEVIEKTENIIE